MPKIIDNAADELTMFITQNNQLTDKNSLWKMGVQFALLYMGFSILKGVFLFFTRQTIIVMSRKIEYDLKNEIFSKYQQLNIAFFKKNRTGDLMNRISEDVTKVRLYLGPAIMYSINVFVLFILVITFMLYKNATLTFYVLLPLPILSFIIYKVSSIINKKSEITQEKQSTISSFVQEVFSGIRVVKAYNRTNYFTDQYKKETQDYKRASLSLALVNSLFLPSIILLIGLSTILTIYLGGMKAINNEVDYGDILQFIFYINMLTWPFASIGWVSSLVQRAAASQKRINEFLHTNDKIIDLGTKKFKQIEKLEFKQVNFKYPTNNEFSITNLNCTLKPGESLGIFGKTGSGKSTVAQLICRLYEINSGDLLINDIPIKELNLSTYKKKVGYIPQDVFLFSDTIKNNIAFGLDSSEYNDQQIESAAKKAGILKEINEFPMGIETEIGERGVTLSGGQRQRVSIARALIRDPELIIFDDCLSAVDSETAKLIMEEIKLSTTKTISVHISHRVNEIIDCDHILVFDNGKIIEKGNHKQLLKHKGFYHRIYTKQQLEEINT